MRYAVVIEKGPTSYGAYVPDLPGCVVVGKTAAEVKQLDRRSGSIILRTARNETSGLWV